MPGRQTVSWSEVAAEKCRRPAIARFRFQDSHLGELANSKLTDQVCRPASSFFHIPRFQ
jgi:hypothetical protein